MARFIAEISSNHNGDKQRCLDLISAAARCGCWGVKFQLFRIEKLFSPEVLQVSKMHRERRRWELPLHFLPDLAGHARQHGLAFGCTPFDLEAVALLEPHVDFLKIASYELPWLDLVSRSASTGLPLMMSCGMADEREISAAVEVAAKSGCSDLTVFHCVSNYPVEPENCHLAAIGGLRQLVARSQTEAKLGWSDHSVNPGVISRAVNHWGAEVVEFHFDLEGQGDEFTAGHCWLPEIIAPVIEGQAFEVPADCDGNPELSPVETESEERQWRADPVDGLRPVQSIRQAWADEQKSAEPEPLALMVAGGPGLGHVARLLALAEALRDDHGFRVEFFIPDSGGAERMLGRHGFAWHLGSVPVDEWVQLGPGVCILDQKESCSALLAGLSTAGMTTVVIDRPDHPEAHLGIVPCYGWDAEKAPCHFHGGPDYLLVRSDITRLRPEGPGSLGQRLVISFGGEDPFMLTEKTVRALADLPNEIDVDIVVGPGFTKHRKTWPSSEFDRPNFNLINTGDPLETILPKAGLLVTALGVSIAEAQVMGVPVAVLSNYESDAEQANHLVQSGSIEFLGFHESVSEPELGLAISRLLESPELRQGLVLAGLKNVDGLGARRSAQLVGELVLSEDHSC